MVDPELAPFLGEQWPARNHWAARARLEGQGWAICGQGDWAYGYRSPSGRLLARVSPFEPAYRYFVDLCERCAGNRYLPRIDLATQLEGGGHLAVLEYLDPMEASEVKSFLRNWEHPADADKDLRSLRAAVDMIDRWGRENLRWWVGVDIGERHVLLSSDGNPKVIDLFGLTSKLVNDLIDDPLEFRRYMPLDQCRYLLDMPDLQLDDNPAEHLQRIRRALEVANAAT